MKKPDDHTLTTSQEAKVIAEAKKVLNEALYSSLARLESSAVIVSGKP